MKYIRTEDGLYEISENANWRDGYDGRGCYLVKINGEDYHIGAGDIIAQADTIEELCDAYVVFDENQDKKPLSNTFDNKELYEQMKVVIRLGMLRKLNVWLKLAIWTSKGLKYIAKMNSNGELELI